MKHEMSRRLKEEKRGIWLSERINKWIEDNQPIFDYMKQNKVSYSTAKLRLFILESDSIKSMRIKELMATGYSFATARRIMQRESKGLVTHNEKWIIDQGYTKESLKDFKLIPNEDVDCGFIILYKGKACSTTLVNNHSVVVNYYDSDFISPNTGSKRKGGCRTISIGILVYVNYIGDVPVGYVVDHIDNNGYNNNLDNLQLLSRLDNLQKNPSKAKFKGTKLTGRTELTQIKQAYVSMIEKELFE